MAVFFSISNFISYMMMMMMIIPYICNTMMIIIIIIYYRTGSADVNINKEKRNGNNPNQANMWFFFLSLTRPERKSILTLK